jgi:hypothetical protein
MSVVMLASIGSFPASVALSGVMVHSFGPVPFFPASGAVVAVAILFALTQGPFRRFGATSAPAAAHAAAA